MWKKNIKDRAINQQYYMTKGLFNICKVTVNGKLTYELWTKGERLGIYNSFDEAKGKV